MTTENISSNRQSPVQLEGWHTDTSGDTSARGPLSPTRRSRVQPRRAHESHVLACSTRAALESAEISIRGTAGQLCLKVFLFQQHLAFSCAPYCCCTLPNADCVSGVFPPAGSSAAGRQVEKLRGEGYPYSVAGNKETTQRCVCVRKCQHGSSSVEETCAFPKVTCSIDGLFEHAVTACSNKPSILYVTLGNA